MHIQRIGRIEKTYRYFQRFEEVVRVVFKYGLDDLIRGFELPAPLDSVIHRLVEQRGRGMLERPIGERVRLALQELGPTFIKMGQILSMRVELLPAEVIRELRKLQDQVPPFDFQRVPEIVRAEFGCSIEELFSSFEEEPFGSASLGQVHKAVLRENGRTVAVKIQRPDILEQIEQDLEILMYLAEFSEKHIEQLKFHRPTKVIAEFSRSLENELDYRQELAHIRRFRQIFADDPHVCIMETFPQQSSARVLTMEYIQGIHARDLDELERKELDRKVIADRGVNAVLRQIFEEGFFHADPHPGNIFVLNNNVISFIDCGMVGRLNRHHRHLMASFLMALSQRDAERATKLLLRITDYEQEPDQSSLETRMSQLIDRYVSKPLKEISFEEIFMRLNNVLTAHGMIFPANYSLMLKAIVTLEGLGRSLDPAMNLTEKLTPYFYRMRLERLDPRNIVRDMGEVSEEMWDFFRRLPEQLGNIIEQFHSGRSRLVIEHRASDTFKTFWNQVANRLAMSLILSALLISSAIIVLSEIPPTWRGIPVIGLAGFVLSGILSLHLLYSIWRHGMF
ncbi:MAG: ABC1 kinase family protein [Candidatus Omnitrophota bacterium]